MNNQQNKIGNLTATGPAQETAAREHTGAAQDTAQVAQTLNAAQAGSRLRVGD